MYSGGVDKMNIRSYWSEGSRTSYAIVHLNTGAVSHVPDCHPFFGAETAKSLAYDVDNFELDDNTVVVSHTIFCGKKLGLAVYTNQEVD